MDFGYIRLETYLTVLTGESGYDWALATFSEIDPAAAGLAEYGVSNGYCYAVDCSHGCAVDTQGSGSLSDSSPAQLDAGTLAIKHDTSVSLNQYGGFYAALLSGSNGTRFLWGFTTYPATAAGGQNVGPFTVSDTTPGMNIKITNVPEFSAVPRSSDLTLQWSGADAALQNGEVTIGAFSYSSDYTKSAFLQCTAPSAAGQFTIPAWVLSTLPASGTYTYAVGSAALPLGSLSIGQYSIPTTFSATGLNRGIITDIFFYRQQVSFQ